MVWLNQLLKLTASSQTVYLTLPPPSCAVPRCRAICACLACRFSSSSCTWLDCTPKPVFPGSSPRVPSYYCGSTQGQDKGMASSDPKCDFCNECISSGKAPLSAALPDFRITVLSCSILNCHLKNNNNNNYKKNKQLKWLSNNSRADHHED